ncbi:MAG: thiosulfate oxidation carrier protein SoxY [Alphaproteobacteria bacterium]
MVSRRAALLGAGAAGGFALLPGTASATVELRDQVLAELTRVAPVDTGRVTLTIPGVAENGLSVYTIVEVESPMTEADHVRAVHILAANNPIARLFTASFTPASGIARVATNIRLGGSQEVTALAEMSDGSFWQDRKQVVVTIAACVDGG